MIDLLLNGFNLGIETKKELLESLSLGFQKEFKIKKNQRIQLDKKYRNHYKLIDKMMKLNISESDEWKPLEELLINRSLLINPLFQQILNEQNKGKLEINIVDLISSYMHMSLNRLFLTKQRFHEMIIYYFLIKYYNSAIARQKYTVKNYNKTLLEASL